MSCPRRGRSGESSSTLLHSQMVKDLRPTVPTKVIRCDPPHPTLTSFTRFLGWVIDSSTEQRNNVWVRGVDGTGEVPTGRFSLRELF